MNDENLKKGKRFSSEYQPSPEAKSRGMIKANAEKNIILNLRSKLNELNTVDKVVEGVNKEIENGVYKNAIELIKIAKEPEKQEIDLTNKTPQIVVASQADADIIKNIQNVKINENIL